LNKLLTKQKYSHRQEQATSFFTTIDAILMFSEKTVERVGDGIPPGSRAWPKRLILYSFNPKMPVRVLARK
jgi:hypothetical protein